MWGKLMAINLQGCNEDKVKSKRELKKFVKQLCYKLKMQRAGAVRIKKFGESSLNGFSAMQFIKTSTITVHLDEKDNKAFIDIFSCKDFNEKEIEKFCLNFFKARNSKSRIFIRD